MDPTSEFRLAEKTPRSSSQLINISGIPVHLYGVDELTLAQAKNVTVVFHVHGRTKTYKDGAEFAHHVLYKWRPLASTTRGLVIIAFDNPNHGRRAVDDLEAKEWRAGNLRHGQDLLATIDGAVQNVQIIMTYLETYVENVFLPTCFISTGTSLGGHITWNLVATDNRIQHGIPIVGSPDVTGVLKDRLARYKNLKEVPEGIEEWPQSLDRLYQARDESVARISGKKILILNGADDPLVPSRFTHRWVENAGGRNTTTFLEMKNTGHVFSYEMMDLVIEWLFKLIN